MKKSLLLLSFFAAATVSQAVDTAYSPVQGGMTISAPALQTTSVSLPLLHASVGSGAMMGKITGVGSNYLDAADAAWTAGTLSSASNPYYVRITSGAAAGRILQVSTTTANTSTRVTVANDGVDLTLSGGPTNGDNYELVLADTLSSLFGSTTLQGGADATVADNVMIWSSTAWTVYYYNTTRSRWERSTDTAASSARDNQVLRPDRGLMIVRKQNSPVSLTVTGRVSGNALKAAYTQAGTSFLNHGLPIATTLGELSLQTKISGWVAGTSPTTATADADYVQVWASTQWLNYYYDSNLGFWRRTTDSAATNRNSISISAGRPIMIVRQGATSGSATVTLPAPPVI